MLATDSTGSAVVSNGVGTGCDTGVENILVVIITDGEESERFELMTVLAEDRDFAEVDDFVGLRSDGSRFAVEVIGCFDDFVPTQGTCG